MHCYRNPALIVQSDRLGGAQTVLTCGFTTRPTLAMPLRPVIGPTPANGLGQPSSIMVEKLAAVSRTKLGERIGVLTQEDMDGVEQVLGFAG